MPDSCCDDLSFLNKLENHSRLEDAGADPAAVLAACDAAGAGVLGTLGAGVAAAEGAADAACAG